jgi:type II secretory pathway component GspD/PulD (secretin)
MRKNRLRFACAPILFGCVFWGGALVFAQNQPAAPVVYGGLSLHNASLTEVVDMLARQLKINYVIDPQVKGSVILNTYGETRNLDTRSLLEMILRLLSHRSSGADFPSSAADRAKGRARH